MKISYFGHSCFLVEINTIKILFDPFITPNELAKNINVSEIKSDFILISHGHEDHIADAVLMANKTGAKVVSNWEIISWMGKNGITKTHPMNTGGKWKFYKDSSTISDQEIKNFTVKCTNAVHSSSFPDGTYGGNPMGFLIESGKEKFYYSGDTALTTDMKLIGEYDKPAVAFLPIGDNFTMGIEDAVIAAEFAGCKKIIGLHYDTFGFIKINHGEAKKKFSDSGKELILMEIGEELEVEG